MKKLLAPLAICSVLSTPVEAKSVGNTNRSHTFESAIIEYQDRVEVPQLGLTQRGITCGPHTLTISDTRFVLEDLLSGIGVTLNRENVVIDQNKDGLVSKTELQNFLEKVSLKMNKPIQNIVDAVVSQYITSLENSGSAICNDFFPQK